MEPHKGTELNNVKETWQQNEQQDSGRSHGAGEPTTVSNDLQETIAAEAAEYDRANKEDRTLGGDRATVSDDEGGGR